jgi:alkanesulfonate monooxygenase SsuD/methylene tetrahydromethanopterin reductase-like flavin-dependent oxidoreductase (luciferase family)
VTDRLSFGIYAFPQAAPYEQLRQLAQRAEATGFDSLWVADETPMAYPGVIELEAFTLLGAMARDTTRIGLGTLVTPPVLRHPLVTAMAATTVDHLSGGRLTLGFGVGGVQADLAGVGQGGVGRAELVDRLDEQLDTIDRLLRGETVTREGGFYPTANAVVQRPVQQPRPSILVAAQGPKSIRVAARRADIWNSAGGEPIEGERVGREGAVEKTRRHVELLEEVCAEVGRNPKTIRRSVLCWRAGALESTNSLADWVGRYVELGFREFVFYYPDDPSRAAVVDRFVGDQRDRSIG